MTLIRKFSAVAAADSRSANIGVSSIASGASHFGEYAQKGLK
ncbi:hypothetical protein [Microcoleus sp.]